MANQELLQELPQAGSAGGVAHDPHRAAVALAEEANGRREELVRARRIPADLFQRSAEAGLFRQMLARQLGGLGRSPAEWFETGVAMARWEPSFAWVVTQGAGDVATYVAASEREFADTFLADQHVYSASSDNGVGTLVPEGNGYRVEGRWGFCSGCQGATWVGGFARFPADIAPNQTSEGRWVLVPVARARIDENWDTMGMIGTGSHSIVLESQHVPAAWTCLIERSGPVDYGQASIAAGNGYWPIATAASAMQLGIARRALDSAEELALKKPLARSAELLCKNAHVQRKLMSAEAAWSASKAGVELVLRQMWEAAEQNRKLPPTILMALGCANVHAAATATDIVESVCDVISTSIAPSRSIFGACLRDARTIGSHIAVNPVKLELIAKMKFGLADYDQPY
jgi:alkylation response protein AidB-like acyl-CoA dehydrogenase